LFEVLDGPGVREVVDEGRVLERLQQKRNEHADEDDADTIPRLLAGPGQLLSEFRATAVAVARGNAPALRRNRRVSAVTQRGRLLGGFCAAGNRSEHPVGVDWRFTTASPHHATAGIPASPKNLTNYHKVTRGRGGSQEKTH
jgi:hypothetical protein